MYPIERSASPEAATAGRADRTAPNAADANDIPSRVPRQRSRIRLFERFLAVAHTRFHSWRPANPVRPNGLVHPPGALLQHDGARRHLSFLFLILTVEFIEILERGIAVVDQEVTALAVCVSGKVIGIEGRLVPDSGRVREIRPRVDRFEQR